MREERDESQDVEGWRLSPATFILARSFGIVLMRRDAVDDSTEKTET